MTSGGNNFNDFPETVPTREIATETGKTFLDFSVVAVGLFIKWAQRCNINSSHVNPALFKMKYSECRQQSRHTQRHPTTSRKQRQRINTFHIAQLSSAAGITQPT